MRFRKKPVEVNAVQWFKIGDHPLVEPCPKGYRVGYDIGDEAGWIKTLEGGHIVTPGDWIITGVKGEHYPCKDDIFRATYEQVS